jgi:hypothetical protein
LKTAVHRRYQAEFAGRQPPPQGHEVPTVDRIEAANKSVETILTQMARCWPANGLCAKQLTELEPCFVETAEIRYRLAVKLNHTGNRAALLDRNRTELKAFLGLSAPAGVFDAYFQPEFDRTFQLIYWTAMSHVARREGDSRGVGRLASIAVEPLTKLADHLLQEPYIAARQPTQFQSAALRAACAYLFALLVAETAPPALRNQVRRLRELALEHAGLLLRALGEHTIGDGRILDCLIHNCIHVFRGHCGLSAILHEWQTSPDMPIYPKALAAWCAPSETALQEALELFGQVAVPPPSARQRAGRANRLASLADLAVDACWASQATAAFEAFSQAWRNHFEPWRGLLGEPWREAPTQLWRALAAEGPERRRVLIEPTFRSSNVFKRLTATPSQDGNQL